MPALKARKKTSKTSKTAKATKKRVPKSKKRVQVKAKALKRSRVRAAKKPKPLKPHPDETSVRLGPHHVDRQPVPAGIQVHAAPAAAGQYPNIFIPAATTHRQSVRHH